VSLPPLASGENLATLLGGDADDGTDGQLSRWAVGIVSAWVRSYCRLSITPVVGATLTLTGTRGRRLVVGERPLTAVSAVSIDGTALVPTEYRWNRQGSLFRDAGWGGEDRAVIVVCIFGFDQVPADLWGVVETASTRLIVNPAGWKSLREAGSTGGEAGGSHERVAMSHGPTGFTAGELAVLNRYRRRVA